MIQWEWVKKAMQHVCVRREVYQSFSWRLRKKSLRYLSVYRKKILKCMPLMKRNITPWTGYVAQERNNLPVHLN